MYFRFYGLIRCVIGDKRCGGSDVNKYEESLFGFFSVAGIARGVSDHLMLMEGSELEGVSIMQDSSVLTDLLLERLCVERPLLEFLDLE